MKYGKSIRLFLIDGDPNGRWACELSNWTGKAYKIPRTLIKESKDRSELSGTGVYFLFGHSDENGEDQVYIGEAEKVYERLMQHLLNKEFWTECIVFCSKDEHLNKAHIKFLENKIFMLAKESNRYHVINTNTPTLSSLSEADRAEMEEFIENTKLLLNTLGHKVLEPAISIPVGHSDEVIFHINAARGADAAGKMVSDGFVVLKGSKVASSTVPSMSYSLKAVRDKLIVGGIINASFEMTEDRVFTSPSLAAAIVMGRTANGLAEWKSETGKSLKDHEIGH